MKNKDMKKKCLKCGHEWFIRSLREPRMCPKCKRINWDRPKEKGRL